MLTFRIFCRVRVFLSTCKKNNLIFSKVNSQALSMTAKMLTSYLLFNKGNIKIHLGLGINKMSVFGCAGILQKFSCLKERIA